MPGYYNIIKADYQQRFRSYTFMVTLLVSVIVAYSFVPVENASYTTIQVGKYAGLNNAAWIGHVTAMMANVFLWLIGFYIINNGIRRDKETGVGQIIATTSVTDFRYLSAKSISNFLVLLTITIIIFLMAFGLVIVRGSAYEFNITQFVLPYLFATMPSLFILSVLAVVFEVVFGRRTNLLNVIFFVFFCALVALFETTRFSNSTWIDPLGIKYLSNEILSMVNSSFGESNLRVSVGFTFQDGSVVKRFLYPGSNFTATYILSRLLWVLFSIGLLRICAVFFNRFDTNYFLAKKDSGSTQPVDVKQSVIANIKAGSLQKVETDFGIYPLLKTEFLLLLRKGPGWFWIVNAGIFIALAIIPLPIALKTGLPVFWFLQINRWADLSTKEKFFGTDKFIYSTYKPLKRLLLSQILAGVFLALLLALPVILKLIMHSEIMVACEVVLGAIVLITFAVCCGIVWGGKRFYEISFFMFTYLGVQGLPFVDYWGGSHIGTNYIGLQILIFSVFLCFAFIVRKYTIQKQ